MTLTSVRSTLSFTVPIVSGCSVSGTKILAIISVPGAVMMTAVSRCCASIPNRMYAAMMPPEMCAIPDVMTVISSDSVIRGRNGRMVSGASVCPMKMLAATFSDSAPDARITPPHHHREQAHDDLHDAEVVEDGEERRDEDDRRQHLKGEHHAVPRALGPEHGRHDPRPRLPCRRAARRRSSTRRTRNRAGD